MYIRPRVRHLLVRPDATLADFDEESSSSEEGKRSPNEVVMALTASAGKNTNTSEQSQSMLCYCNLPQVAEQPRF